MHLSLPFSLAFQQHQYNTTERDNKRQNAATQTTMMVAKKGKSIGSSFLCETCSTFSLMIRLSLLLAMAHFEQFLGPGPPQQSQAGSHLRQVSTMVEGAIVTLGVVPCCDVDVVEGSGIAVQQNKKTRFLTASLRRQSHEGDFSGFRPGRSKLLRSLRHYLGAQRYHNIDSLEERGVERGSVRRPSLKGRERAFVSQTNIKAF